MGTPVAPPRAPALVLLLALRWRLISGSIELDAVPPTPTAPTCPPEDTAVPG